MNNPEQLLRPDGFSGAYADMPDSMNPETIANLTSALTAVAHQDHRTGPVVIGRGPEEHHQELERGAVAGALHAGAEVVRLGERSQPDTLYTAQTLGALATVSITTDGQPQDVLYTARIGAETPDKEQLKRVAASYRTLRQDSSSIPMDAVDAVQRHRGDARTYSDALVEYLTDRYGEKPLDGTRLVLSGQGHGGKPARGPGKAMYCPNQDAGNGPSETMSATLRVLRGLGAQVAEHYLKSAPRAKDGLPSLRAHLEGPDSERLRQYTGAFVINDNGTEVLAASTAGRYSLDGDSLRKAIERRQQLHENYPEPAAWPERPDGTLAAAIIAIRAAETNTTFGNMGQLVTNTSITERTA
ncbi:hypothetical protein CR970_03740 [Candidatus Saccharibacteria bacterium]|nr:MAG: hypothetical protein CR970_03740 [Candidatus Saccharibacteria bacterium]